MAILLLYPLIWNAISPPRTPVTAPSDTTKIAQPPQAVTPSPETLSTAKPPAGTISSADTAPLPPTQRQAEQLINVETRDLRVTLSSHGGIIRQVVLKSYARYDGNPVALIGNYSKPDWAGYGALTVGYADQLLPFNSYSFQANATDTILTDRDSIAVVTFKYLSSDGASVTKKYVFRYADYLFHLDLEIRQPLRLGLGQGITIGWYAPMEPTEQDYNQDKGKVGGFFSIGGALDYFKKLENGVLHKTISGPIDWAAVRTKYFAAVIMAPERPAKDVVVLGGQIDVKDPRGNAFRWDEYGVGLTYEQPADTTSLSFDVYTGPLDYDRLRGLGQGLTGLIDFGWKFFRPFAVAILWLFTSIHKAIANYGIVIIVFSVLMKIIFWPLSIRSAKSMYKMKEIQPRLQEIKEKFKNDPAKLNQETMKAYKEFGVNPFGSCLPMLIQLPIFWALYSVLSNTIELRGADFVFWIKDLSQPDPSGRPFTFGIGILPLIMGIAMFFQQKMTITDPKQKMMVYMMPALFTFLFSRWASGLVLYWTVFSIMGIVEQWFVMRHIKAEQEAKRS
jgi:YidC/Oxa1 family membrane protein insertase